MSFSTVMGWVLLFSWLSFAVVSGEKVFFSNSWAVEVKNGQSSARDLANKHGFLYKGQVIGDYYHFVHPTSPLRARRKRYLLHPLHHILKAEQQVGRVDQQVIRRRYKRSHSYTYSPPSNTGWKEQWYLYRSSGHDMNVQKTWEQNITGRGIVISILDDGIEYTHPDLQANYDPIASYDFNDYDSDPIPRYDPTNENKHGTRCAGEVASSKSGHCGVGAAFGAKVGGIRMLDGDVTDIIEASSLSLKPQHIHIYSSSWGPNDDGSTVDGPGPLATKAFIEGILHGRNGLGSIFVWASGNGGRYGDSCNCDGYAVSPLTISVSSSSELDDKPWYLEQCSSTLASTYSSGGIHEKQIMTTDLHHGCTNRHTGTSASAPLAAAMIALALEANPNLTWRDVQYLVVLSSDPRHPHDDHWQKNGAGLRVSHWYGFGIIDGTSLVNRARHWIPVPKYVNCSFNVTPKLVHGSSMASDNAPLSVIIPVETCSVIYVEHVQAIASIRIGTGVRGDVSIFLTSPAGTKSVLLPFRSRDMHKDGFHLWPFMTVHMWGEQPGGDWILDVHVNHGGSVHLDALQLIIHGAPTVPASILSIPSSCHPQCLRGCTKEGARYCDICKHYRVALDSECVERCPTGTFLDHSTCRNCCQWCAECMDGHSCLHCQAHAFQLPDGSCSNQCPKQTFPSMNRTCILCHQSCFSCDGPREDDCTGCHPQYVLKDRRCEIREPTSCPVQQYFDHRSHECRLCHKSCASCTGKESTQCASCSEGTQLNKENECVDLHQHQSCNPDQYFDKSSLECKTCPSVCTNCSGNLTCMLCPEGLLTWNGTCVKSCPHGTFAQEELCTPCIEHCQQCLSLDTCTKCDNGYYLLNSSVAVQCVTTCPLSYVLHHSNFCQPCPPNCMVCYDPWMCHSCKEGFVYYAPNQVCQPNCPEGYFASAANQCVSCKPPCSTCSSSASNCSSCLPGLAWNPPSMQCITCCNLDELTTDCCNCYEDGKICHLSNISVEIHDVLQSSSAISVRTIVAGIVFSMTVLTCLTLGLFLVVRNCHSRINPRYHQVPRVDGLDVFDDSDSDTEIYKSIATIK